MKNKELDEIDAGMARKDYSISCARFIAMCFIVACHVMQRDAFASDVHGAHIEWAFWFNVGVQMFLFISGFLYGKKDRIDVVAFYKKSFPKLLVDYYVFIFAMLLLIYFSPLMSIGKLDALRLLTFSGTVPGLGHLWFIPTILFCYLLSPVLSEIIKAIDKRSDTRFFIESIILLLVVHVVIDCFFGAFSPAWINCFVIGMLFAKAEYRKSIRSTAIILSAVACLIIIPIQFRFDYWPHGELPKVLSWIYGDFVQYGHVFLGITLVVFIRFVYNRQKSKPQKHSLLDWSDKYSYDVYLVHHVFVQSAFGCVEFISNRWVALPLAVALTIVFSLLLYAVAAFIRNKAVYAYGKLPN